jgi:hypothetical protein
MRNYIVKAETIGVLEGSRINITHNNKKKAINNARKIIQLAGGQWSLSVETWRDDQLISIEYLER